jgi:hypothetical protein
LTEKMENQVSFRQLAARLERSVFDVEDIVRDKYVILSLRDTQLIKF